MGLGPTDANSLPSFGWSILDTVSGTRCWKGFVPAGMWMVVWPLFAEQFYNERFIVMVLGIGVSVGARAAIRWGGEGKAEGLVKREDVRKSVEEVMSRSREGEEMRKRALGLQKRPKGLLEEKVLEEKVLPISKSNYLWKMSSK
ncbi:anthocyanidin 3-O-glucosyltransferase 4-like [Eucalyptus grandis]|uniref:anthocyanidin 3-O-glucosyltransferase 4-like n=1 Tax=Eucalyptus grandis TaxID=71139 RepID=UPI00192EBF74|nr:anthocyanidin 3-O-glucosyltransferase 4-like [Eucalyptus grandis]